MGLFRKKKPGAGGSPPQPPQPPRESPDALSPREPQAAAAGPSSPPAPAADPGPATVTTMDAFGRAARIPREQWRKEVLPQMVQALAPDPARLAALILQCLRDGLAADLLPAALRLAAADPDPERSLSILAAVQRDAGEPEDAAATLRELQQKRPQSASARVGFALLQDRAGRRAPATALLWEALQLEPNHPDALHGWLQWERERVGADGYPAVLAAACALPAAWRALLWRARELLAAGRVDDAVADHRAVLAQAGDESDALAMIASDLVRAGAHDLVAELVLPRYRIERHHPGIGLELLAHYLAKKQPLPGQQLLHELRVRFPRVLDSQLARFDAQFTALMLPPAPALTAPPRVALWRLDRPLWYLPLGEPLFLLPPKAGPRRVLLAALAAQVAGASAQMQREDDVGRLTRSVPLFLAEQLWLGSPLPAAVVLPVADGGGWVVSAVPWEEERLAQLLAEPERPDTLIVTGTVRPDGNKRRIDLWVYEARTRQRLGHAAADGEDGKLGPALLQLLAELSPILGGPPALRPPVGSEPWWERYANALAQLAALVTAQLGAIPKDRLYGQRAILEWLLAVALDEPRYTPARLALAAGLCADAALGSPIHKELAAPFAELFRQEPAGSAFAQTAVQPLRKLGLLQLWQRRRAEIVAAGSDGYRAWLQKVEGAP